MGGQAVMEGVMMRGFRSWAVAVRTPEGDVEVQLHDAPRWAERYSKIPLLRGVMALAESLALGFKALAWSANRQVPEEERLSKGAMTGTIAVAPPSAPAASTDGSRSRASGSTPSRARCGSPSSSDTWCSSGICGT